LCSSLTVYVPLGVLLAAIAPRIRGDARRPVPRASRRARRSPGGLHVARDDVGHREELSEAGKTARALSAKQPSPPWALRAVLSLRAARRGPAGGRPRRSRRPERAPRLAEKATKRETTFTALGTDAGGKSTHTAGTTKSMPFFGDDAVYVNNANDTLYGGGFTSDRPTAHEGLTGHPGYPPSILRPVPSAPPFRLTTPVRCHPFPRGPPAGRRTGAASL
jgi:hypothetical protein